MTVDNISYQIKICKKCKIEKPLSGFHKDARTKDGLLRYCKKCVSVISAAYIAANREKCRAASAAYRAANPDKVRAAKAAYAAANPDKRCICAHNRRAKERANGGKLSPDLSAKLFKLQKGKCACCGLSLGDNFHLDHIMPIALGGVNEDWNIQLLRSHCNNQKYTKHPVDFMQMRGFLL